MSSWDDESAKKFYRLLYDVDFFLARARTTVRNGDYFVAWQAVGHAVSAKHEAIKCVPQAESDNDDMGVDYEEVYRLEWDKMMNIIAAMQGSDVPQDPSLPDKAQVKGNLERVIRDFQRMQSSYWPADSMCGRAITEIVSLLRQLIRQLDVKPSDWGAINRIRKDIVSKQEQWMKCIYPDNSFDMLDFTFDLIRMDWALIELYIALKYQRPVKLDLLFTPKTILELIESIEEMKHKIMEKITDEHEGASLGVEGPDYEPTPDLPPWPPDDHV